jgi:hypothetical protein
MIRQLPSPAGTLALVGNLGPEPVVILDPMSEDGDVVFTPLPAAQMTFARTDTGEIGRRGPGTAFALPAAVGLRVVPPLAGAEVAPMRGTLWPGEETALLHRAPPIDGTGSVRLLVVLDVPGGENDDDCGCCP